MDQNMRSATEPKKKKYGKKLFTIIMFSSLAVALVAVSFAYYKEKNAKLTMEDVQSLQQQDVDMTLTDVARHIHIPQDAQPTVATITNVDNLRKEMPFFNKAENGFKVIVFEEKAILFDPINKIIIDVAPIKYRQAQKTDDKLQKDNVKKEVQKDVEEKKVSQNQDESDLDKKDVSEDLEEDAEDAEDTEIEVEDNSTDE